MPGVPSNKACERCKKRHLKCDETRPHCQRCTNAGVDCPGYVQTRKFIDQGASVRRRYAPYQENASKPPNRRGTASTTKSYTPAPEQNAEKSPATQSQSPSGFTQLSTNTVGASGSLVASQRSSQIPSESPIQVETPDPIQSRLVSSNALSSVPSQSSSGATPSVAPCQVTNVAIDQAKSGAYHDIQRQLSPHARMTSPRSPSQEGEEFQDIFSELMTGTEHEISFLVRHFSEVLAVWLDLSDMGKFFEAHVPVRAIDEPCLKFAIAALSAKHLGRMKGVKFASASGMFTSPSATETYPNALQVDWFLKAANYYYLAMSHMNSSVFDAYAFGSTSALLESPLDIVNRWLSLRLKKNDGGPQGQSASDPFWKKTENLLATSTILTVYKILDEPGERWQSYLTGMRPLFDQLIELIANTPEITPAFSHGVLAVFWNLARLDYMASYFNRWPTQLDPENLLLWRAAGLALDDEGNPCSLGGATASRVTFSQEDRAMNSLTRLLNRVTNFLAASKRSQLEQWVGRPSSDISSPSESQSPTSGSYPTTASWLKLSFEFQSWVERVPETFRPCLRLDQPRSISKSPDIGHMPFPEIFYSLTSCAAAMQQYHFGRLALSLNRPSDDVAAPSTAVDRLQGYRELTKEVDYRCREICGIALSRPESPARVHMIALLYAVGQCLERPEERQIVVDLLRGIEADLGWATNHQVEKLQKSWGDRS